MSDSEYSFGWTSVEENETNSDKEEEVETVQSITKKSSQVFDDPHSSETSSIPATVMVKEERIDSPIDDTFNNATLNDLNISSRYSLKRSPENSFDASDNRLDEEILKKFIDENPNLRTTAISQEDFVTENDDLWLIQCPPRFDVSSLINLKILDKDKSKLKIPNSKFECVNIAKDSNQEITMISPATSSKSCSINNYTIKGKYIIREKMKSAISVGKEKEQASNVPFPANLKVRHPLFGGDYKKHIKLPSIVCEKLANPPTRSSKSLKKEKNVQDHEVDDQQVHNTTVTKQHKKKRKGSPSLFDESVKSKKMKITQKMWETETSIEQSLFDSPIVKKKKKVK